MTISNMPHSSCPCCRNRIIVVVMVTTAVVAVCLCVVVVVVTVIVAMRRARYQVVSRVKVTEWKSNYFVWLDPAAVVKLKPLQVYYLHKKHSKHSIDLLTHNFNNWFHVDFFMMTSSPSPWYQLIANTFYRINLPYRIISYSQNTWPVTWPKQAQSTDETDIRLGVLYTSMLQPFYVPRTHTNYQHQHDLNSH